MNVRSLVFCVATCLLCFLAPVARGEDLSLCGKTKVRLVAADEAKELLAARDQFATRLSLFDRQSRMQADEQATLEEWLRFNATHARDWDEAATARVRPAIDDLRPRLEQLSLSLPETIRLARTSGKEEGDAAYTRGSTVFLPDRVIAYPKAALEKLLLHELFHILSRNDPALRQKLYAIIGFRPCDPIKLPDDWEERRITNPDAPLVDCYIELTVNGGKVIAAPLLYASAAKYDPKSGGAFFKYLTFRLLVLNRDGQRLVPAIREGKPVVFDPRGVEDFFTQVGRNTNYIVHPDEILADNFVLVVLGNENVPTPRIVEEMKKLLAK